MAIIPAPRLDRRCGTFTQPRRTKWTECLLVTSSLIPQGYEGRDFLEKRGWTSRCHAHPASAWSSFTMAQWQRSRSKDFGDRWNCLLLYNLCGTRLLAVDSIRWVNGRVARRLY